jgi:hypothetical protein
MIIATYCACKEPFCIACRLPEVHHCKYDFREEGKRILAAANPVVVGKKVDKL